MKKTLIAAFVLFTCACLLVLSGCGDSPTGGDEGTHTHTDGLPVIENDISATCYEEGSYDEVVYCSDCQEEISRTHKTIQKAEHTPSDPTVENEIFSTCDSEGSYDVAIYCAICSEELSRETTVVEKTEHTPTSAVIENKTDATCSNEGSYDVVIYCADCDEEISRESKAIEMVSHTPSSPIVENEIEPTCDEDGSYDEVVYCSECDAELSRVEQTTEKKNHSPLSPVKENEKEGTCQSDYTYDIVIYCAWCETELSREYQNEGIGEHSYKECVCSTCNDIKVSEGLKFDYNDDKTSYRVVGMGSCTDTEVSIPSTYNGLPVTGIYQAAFANRTYITYVLIPDSITYIGASAFMGCTGITSISIPNSVTSISDSAFEDCTSLTNVVVPDDLTYFGNGVFYDCPNIQYNKYDNAYYLGSERNPYAYLIMAKDTNITSCTIHSNARIVRSWAFSSCKKLEDITVPKSVEIFEEDVFYMCNSIKNVYITDVAAWCSTQFVSYPAEASYYGLSLYVQGETVTDLVIPEGVTSINGAAFEGFSSLKSVAMPSTLTSIGDLAFAACYGLTSIKIPDSVQSIGKSAFASCSGLTSVTFGNGIKSIGDDAFARSNNITSVYVDDVAVLCNISYGNSSSHPLQYNFGGLYLKEELVTNLVIPDGVSQIAPYAFCKFENFETVVIPEGVKSIGEMAFAYCSSIKNVSIPNSVTSIDPSSFVWCLNINTTEYDNVRYIGSEENPYLLLFKANNTKMTSCVVNPETKFIHDSAFDGCNQLSSITMPKDLKGIGNGVFQGCRSLKNIYISDIASWCSASFGSIPGQTSSEINLYLNEKLVTELDIPNGVTTVSEGAFYNCKSITKVTIPNSVTEIGKSSFYGCTSIESLKLPFLGGEASSAENKYLSYIFSPLNDSGEVPALLKEVIITGDSSIGSYAFKGCSGITNIELLGNITSIGSEAFYGCTGLTSIVIPSSTTSIGSRALMNCTSLEEITLPLVTEGASSNIYFGYYFGAYNYKNNNASVPSTLKTVIINGGDTIGSNAFYDCKGITSITVPSSITEIGSSAFYGCTGITSITVPSSVTEIGKAAFEKCSSLEYISLPFLGSNLDSTDDAYFGFVFGASTRYENASYVPATLKTVEIAEGEVLEQSAFYGCEQITSIVLPNNLKSIAEFSFENCKGITSIVIPDNVTTIGMNAFSNCSSLKNVSIPSAISIIGYNVFYNCTSLEYTEYNNGCYLGNKSNPYAVLVDVKDKSVKSFAAHDDTTFIFNGALNGCTSITSITLPFIGNTLNNKANTHFGYIFGADSYYVNENFVPKSLNTVTVVGDSQIGGYAFMNCTMLKNVYLEGDISSIGVNAFENCKNLINITVPSSITRIEKFAFSGCTSLRYNEQGSAYYLGNSENPYLVLKGVKTNISSCVINSNTKIIYSNAFYECYGIKQIVIPESVEQIGDMAFYGCTGLKSVSIGSSIDAIGHNAFYQCTSITDVYYSGSESDWNNITIDPTNTILQEATIHYNEGAEN